MAMVLKTIVAATSPGVRIPLAPLGFNNSMSGGGARVDDWGCLLSSYTCKRIAGSNPVLPAA
jgi:hypothetical protein